MNVRHQHENCIENIVSSIECRPFSFGQSDSEYKIGSRNKALVTDGQETFSQPEKTPWRRNAALRLIGGKWHGVSCVFCEVHRQASSRIAAVPQLSAAGNPCPRPDRSQTGQRGAPGVLAQCDYLVVFGEYIEAIARDLQFLRER